jgi:hypothetical protein
MESVGASEDVGWLRQCHLFSGKAGMETGDDRTDAVREDYIGCA